MIGSVSNLSFAHYGLQRHPQGERPAGARESEKDELDPKNTLKSEKEEREEKEKFSNPQKLDEDEKRQVEELKQRDAEVRAHEQAHMATAGSLAMGGPSYVFQTGPDGRQYAIGGDVKIDTSPGRTPEETAQKAQQIRAAALAPADPSAQDLKVAAAASSMEVESASKEAGKSEKDSQKSGLKSAKSSDDEPAGEISSSRQVFAATPNDSQNGQEEEENSESRPNPYLALAAQIYGKR